MPGEWAGNSKHWGKRKREFFADVKCNVWQDKWTSSYTGANTTLILAVFVLPEIAGIVMLRHNYILYSFLEA